MNLLVGRNIPIPPVGVKPKMTVRDKGGEGGVQMASGGGEEAVATVVEAQDDVKEAYLCVAGRHINTKGLQ